MHIVVILSIMETETSINQIACPQKRNVECFSLPYKRYLRSRNRIKLPTPYHPPPNHACIWTVRTPSSRVFRVFRVFRVSFKSIKEWHLILPSASDISLPTHPRRERSTPSSGKPRTWLLDHSSRGLSPLYPHYRHHASP